uniref:(northern house mosquito) hypothetical protein n=1 Tax=Culex pipiens TaxID=7175 RepID=A0A8D8PHV9_CULPI
MPHQSRRSFIAKINRPPARQHVQLMTVIQTSMTHRQSPLSFLLRTKVNQRIDQRAVPLHLQELRVQRVKVNHPGFQAMMREKIRHRVVPEPLVPLVHQKVGQIHRPKGCQWPLWIRDERVGLRWIPHEVVSGDEKTACG